MYFDTDFQITPKRLGLICVDAYGPRCFWYLLKLRFQPPFGFGGAIWKNLEQAQIAVMDHMIEKKKRLPKEFAPFQNLVSVVEYPRSYKKFRCRHKSGITLYGEPDSIYEVDDGSIAVIDQKTAHPKEGTDPMLPCYICQTIGYSYIAEFGLKLGTVSMAGLMYWSCQHPDVVADPGAFYENGQLSVAFAPHPLSVDIDYSMLDAPLKEALSVWEAPCPPERGAKCKDCVKLDALLQLESNAQSAQAIADKHILDARAHDPRAVFQVQQRHYNERGARLCAWRMLMDSEEEVEFSNNGMFANWD